MIDYTALQRDALAKELRKHIAGEVRFDQTSRRLYSTDASIYQMEPLGVVIPRSIDDLQITMQIAAEMQIPITARGGGTSLSGQSIGPGVIVDASKYLNRIEEIELTSKTARIQPGVVLDQLNRAAAKYDLQFGPDVATASRANLGGMIGNNSAGARSIVYGKTIDHVRRLKVVLANGQLANFGPLTTQEWNARSLANSPEGAIYAGCRNLIQSHQQDIRQRFPCILRRVSGYSLDTLCDALYPSDGSAPQPTGLHQLIVGSEGTLALIAEAEVNLIPRPKHRGLLVPQFATLADAMTALAVCLEFRPSAVELLDHLLLTLTAQNMALRETMKVIQGNPQALFMVEFSSDDPLEVTDRVERLQKRLKDVPGLITSVPAIDPQLRDPLWNLRRAAMPLLYGMKGDRKPITFVEDCAVDPARLPEFVTRFKEILHRHDTDGAFYGHASVGCLHVRPVLNLKDAGEVALMRRITEEVADLVLEFGGSLSGEHGDGMVRSEWNEKMFGPKLYRVFRQMKHLFDPDHLLNPGKVVDAQPMTENLRYDKYYHPPEPATHFNFDNQEGFIRSIEMCNGSGVCRKREGGTMCPSFRATLDEKDSTRGRANMLRLALANDGDVTIETSGREWSMPKGLHDRQVHDVLDLCLQCKACKTECPSSVDMAKIKAEFLEHYYKGRSRPLGHYLMGRIHRINRLAAPVAPIVNWLQNLRPSRWLMEKLAGIDRRRSLPKIHFHHFRRWFAKHRPTEGVGQHGKVILLDDCFSTWNEPEIGQSAVAVLERAGYEVELSGLTCCGRALISKGFVREARDLVEQQAKALYRRIAEGVPILGLEPSCLLTLADEWTELLPGKTTRAIANACHLADGWLIDQLDQKKTSLRLSPLNEPCLIHGHCHQKALQRAEGTVRAMKRIPGLEVNVLDAGCCGMAGSFGFEKSHYDVSVQVANLALLPALRENPETLVVAPGTSCRHQILDLDGRHALHPMQVLATQLG